MTKLDDLLAKKAQLDERIKQIKQRDQAQKRKDDTRRKVLLGSWLIKEMESDPVKSSEVLASMDSYLTKNKDRTLFDLAVLDDEKSTYPQ